MKQRLFTFALTILVALSSVSTNTLAKGVDTKQIVTANQAAQIETLYQERAVLSLEFEKNRNEIEKIDRMIKTLGAVTVSEEYVIEKMNSCSTMKDPTGSSKASPPNYGGIGWSSYRQNLNVNGTLFEIQVLTGKPNTNDSILMRHDLLSYPQTPNATYQAICDLVFSLAGVGAQFVPELSGIISVADLAKQAYSLATVGNTVTVSGVNSLAFTSVSTEMKLVYVKYKGDLDSKQICMFMGNSSHCKTQFIIGYNQKNPDGSYTATNTAIPKTYSLASQGYSDYNTLCWSYHQYKTSGKAFDEYRQVRNYNLKYCVRKNGNCTIITNALIQVPVI